MSERDPLLRGQPEQGDGVEALPPKDPRRLGPLEISRTTRYGILAGLWTATFLSASWLGTSYLLATCTFTPLYGRLCNVLGRKGANQTAVLFAGLGVLMCGLSRNMEMLIVARFFSGIGGGGVFTTSSIIVSDMYSMRSRGLTQGIASVFNGLGLGLGGPIGGLITDWLGWRWAFLIQIPMFFVSYLLTSWNLNYVTEGAGKSTKEILKRIDYLGSGTLLFAVGSTLLFLSARFNESLPWSHPSVIASITCAGVFAIAFLIAELFISPEPVLARFLLKQRIPVLVGCSNFLVAMCNFSIMYFFPMWFQTVPMTNASTAGLHLLPNSLSMSTGSVFAGWVMHKTGRYKTINLIFGLFPFIGASLIYYIKEDSGFLQSWFSIIPLGFGNAVVLQTMLKDAMAVATGFGQLWRGVGQVGGVAISSAIFQSNLEAELRQRIHTPDADEVRSLSGPPKFSPANRRTCQLILKIRHSARFLNSLAPEIQRQARDSYDISLKKVFFFASCSTLLAYIVRLPIPDKKLEHRPRKGRREPSSPRPPGPSEASSTATSVAASPFDSDNEAEAPTVPEQQRKKGPPRRRLSTYESAEQVLGDLEDNRVANTGRRQ
ncbi:hypothetical protein CVT26_012231 [Gymnopilus dilepis]|uniref:Major facilitator superfamily (MFS) profile domain-containing protein n=1 Tax=Gymnopilus dilepis TaxID=231916 RepID=A0A409YQ54_9AGAR|nr:hypothetical protein CVT26_012231 [Gymnopilus dilepis]